MFFPDTICDGKQSMVSKRNKIDFYYNRGVSHFNISRNFRPPISLITWRDVWGFGKIVFWPMKAVGLSIGIFTKKYSENTQNGYFRKYDHFNDIFFQIPYAINYDI